MNRRAIERAHAIRRVRMLLELLDHLSYAAEPDDETIDEYRAEIAELRVSWRL